MELRKLTTRSTLVLAFTVAASGVAVTFIPGCPTPGPAGCTTNADCDDGDECTMDTCNAAGECVYENICPSAEAFDLGTASDDVIGGLDVTSEITSVTIGSPPVVEFSVTTADGTPITGLGALWEDSNRTVGFTLTKLVPGSPGDPTTRVAYTRRTNDDGSIWPFYDNGSSLVDNGDGTYVFTMLTDVANVSGVSYEPGLTHRVAGHISTSEVPLKDQNLVFDFVPDGSDVTETRNIAAMDSCNECHAGLVFHGRFFKAEYCANCHTPDLAEGEGDFKYMVHKIHAGHTFDVLHGGLDYGEVTYPQGLNNCRKCHSG
ncbi:MAG: hypothetical protein PVI86_19680, partial [Phycisphaerae bacterium]